MRTIFLSLILILGIANITLSQITFYNGIRSGMSKNSFETYCQYNLYGYECSEGVCSCLIDNNKYQILTEYNFIDELVRLTLGCYNEFTITQLSDWKNKLQRQFGNNIIIDQSVSASTLNNIEDGEYAPVFAISINSEADVRIIIGHIHGGYYLAIMYSDFNYGYLDDFLNLLFGN